MNNKFDRDLRPTRPFRSMATRLDERKALEGKRILARRRLRDSQHRGALAQTSALSPLFDVQIKGDSKC